MDDAYWRALMTVDGDILEAVDLLLERPAWHQRAACRGRVDVFFPRRGDVDAAALARRLCAGCPVAAECAAAGVDERAGFWSGRSPMERRRARRTAA